MPDESSTPTSELSIGALFDALADERRRYVLFALKEHERPVALADLADEVAVEENDRTITEIPAEEVKRVYMSLWHSHIPKLVDAGLVEYNQDRGTVTLAEKAEQLEPRIERATAE